ncbi:hypothetical protein [Streptomyces sp. NPDC057199]|uniref:hypothetical protein n=1 Tax=Streptomyces sp. NPDC057199 TaxID=3346047 RepID=UPI00363986D2
MLATAERLKVGARRDAEVLVWHLLALPETCEGDCDFHAIACALGDDDGINVPGPTREVPVNLEEAPGERWCAACLILAQKQVNSPPAQEG